MQFVLFQQVALAQDFPEKGLKRGDVATVVEQHPVTVGEDGYTLEIFNAVGETIAVITVPESALERLAENEIFTVRTMVAA